MRPKRALRRLAPAVVLVAVTLPLAASPGAGGEPTLRLDATLGGPGHAAVYPSGVEFATDGDMVVADTGNNKVKRYDRRPDGTFSLAWETVTTFGSGVNQLNNPRDVGVGSDTINGAGEVVPGDVYVADTVNGRIVRLAGATGAWITSWRGADTDKIGSPMGVTVGGSPERVLVADGLRKKVRILETDGTPVSTFTGSGDCAFSAVRDVDIDAAGNLYVANYLFNNILKMSQTGSCLATWGTKGTASGQFKNPYGVSVGLDPGLGEAPGTEVIFVADSNNNRIQEFRLDGTFVAAFGASGKYDQPGKFSTLRRVAVAPDGDVCGADLWGWRIVCFDRLDAGYSYGRTVPDPLRTPPGYPQRPFTATEAFNEPRGLAFDSAGNTYVADAVNQRIVRMDPSGMAVEVCGDRGEEPTSFNWPRGVAFDNSTGNTWVADTKQSRAQVVAAPFGKCSRTRLGNVGTGTANFNWPTSVAIRASDGTAWFADWKNNRISVWNVATRTPLLSFGSRGSGTGQFIEPRGIGVAPDGSILVADTKNHRVVKLTATQANSGSFAVSWVGTFTAGGTLRLPEGVDGDAAGRIYVADTAHSQLVALDSAGTVLSTLTGFRAPANVAVNDATNRVVVADTYNHRLQVYVWD